MNWDPNLVAESFKNLWPGPLVRESGWLFPFGEAMHFIGLCLLLGSMFIIDLRLMGWFKSISVRAALSFSALCHYRLHHQSGLGLAVFYQRSSKLS